MTKNNPPFYILQYKISLLFFVNPEIADTIYDYCYKDAHFVLISNNIMIRLIKIHCDLEMFKRVENNIKKLLDMDLRKYNHMRIYTREEIINIKSFCNLISNMFVYDVREKITYEYKDFLICTHGNEKNFMIENITTDHNVKYDSVIGADILLLLMNSLFDIQYEKITKDSIGNSECLHV